MFLLSFADFYSKSTLNFSKNSFRNPTRVSDGLDPDQDQHSVGPDLGPSCFQRQKSPLAWKELKKHKLKKRTFSAI